MPSRRIHRVLIANRGEIAVRILKTLKTHNLQSLTIYAPSDANTLSTTLSDISLPLLGTSIAETYLNGPLILQLARTHHVDAIIPGYGFLAEDADFAESVEHAGIRWVGPTPGQMRRLGRKTAARREAMAAGVPVVPGSEELGNVEEAVREAERVGWPVMLKSAAGGGGIGVVRCEDEGGLRREFAETKRAARENFGHEGVFLEKVVVRARHIEVQIIGDGMGRVVAVGERDCSLQRRHQKVIEESPAPLMSPVVRREMQAAAVRLAARVRYRNVGTVEFIYDVDSGEFFFLEVNTRLQVEHAITEAVTGLDLVKCMLEVSEGSFEIDQFQDHLRVEGVSIEARICAESPFHGFIASPGQILDLRLPNGPGIRVDTAVQKGSLISTCYDSLIIKITSHATTRTEATTLLRNALSSSRVTGIATNLPYLLDILRSPPFVSGTFTTSLLATMPHQPNMLEFLSVGAQVTLQDLPGRTSFWPAGIPPSGPMDDLSFRFANHLVGNPPSAAALECIAQGPSIRFHCPAVIAITGGSAAIDINGRAVPPRTPLQAGKNEVLTVGVVTRGARVYIAVRGGFAVPRVFGSRGTFLLGGFGGHNGRKLLVGDTLPVVPARLESRVMTTLPPALPIPPAGNEGGGVTWRIGAVPGPHAWPGHFSFKAYSTLFSATWRVSHNISRLGIRLSGPRPPWGSKMGGEAGLHPSNVHDCPYPVGGVSFTGDEAVVLTRDGPSLGGFVVWCVVVEAEMWKLGQICAGDCIRFVLVGAEEGERLAEELEVAVGGGPMVRDVVGEELREEKGVRVGRWETGEGVVEVLQCGERAVLMDFTGGMPEETPFRMRTALHIYSFMAAHRKKPIPGVYFLAPGVNTLQVLLTSTTSTGVFLETLTSLPRYPLLTRIPSRQISLPLLFNDALSVASIRQYGTTIRPDAPWVPSNIAFMEKLNGLAPGSLRKLMHEAEFLVLGLGDVFMGSPCAVPLDPRHRLFGSKYSPARISTPRGAVGLGGQYLCIYAAESPGGYQLVGRTCDVWDARKIPYSYDELDVTLKSEDLRLQELLNPGEKYETLDIQDPGEDVPWLFRPFDRISFYPVLDPAALTSHGIRITPGVFDMGDYEAKLSAHASEITADRIHRESAYQRSPLLPALLKPFISCSASASATTSSAAAATTTTVFSVDPTTTAERQQRENRERLVAEIRRKLGQRAEVVVAPCPGCCVEVREEGRVVEKGEKILAIEVMKMKVVVGSVGKGKLVRILVRQGEMLMQGDVVAVVEREEVLT